MPAIVKFAAYGGGVSCLAALALCAVYGAEIDPLVLPAGLVLSAAGLAVCAGMLRANATSYRIFSSALRISIATAAILALSAAALSTTAVAAYGIGACVGLALLRQGMNGEPVRRYFGMEPDRPGGYIRRFARANIVFGAGSLLFLLWPGGWQSAAINLALGAGSVALGYGILKARPWVRPVAVALSAVTVLSAAGMAWNPEIPGIEEEIVAQVAMTMLAFSVAWAGFICCLVYARWEQIRAAGTDSGRAAEFGSAHSKSDSVSRP
jgi:hypothetical protein